MESTMEIAKEILNQLGGNKFIAMTGAKNLASGDKALSFKIMRNSKRITHVKIYLNSMDTYDVTFYSIRDTKIKNQYTLLGIYGDMLQSTFTKYTGLDTSL